MFLWKLFLDQRGTTLAITRKTASTSATAGGMNTNFAEIEAVVNGNIDGDNIAADGVAASKLNSDVVRSDYGLKQHTDGSLQVDVSDTNPSLEISDGGVRAKVDDSTIERASGGLQLKNGGITLAKLSTALLTSLYPVGSIYCNNAVSTNPATLFGFGTWVAIGGKVLVGLDGTTEFATLNQTDGEKTHTLTTPEMPAHTHNIPYSGSDNPGIDAKYAITQNNFGAPTSSTGGGGAHNNLQPYLVIYMWYRSA
jgi:hypothetical protein